MTRQRSQRAAIAAVLCALAAPAGAAAAVPNGAQPGNVAPGSATPTTSVPTATTPAGTIPATPGATTPLSATPTGPTGATGPAAVAPGDTVPGAPSTLVVTGHRAHKSSKQLSGLDYVLAVAGALLLLACLMWAFVRWLALEPRWTTATIYSLREASNHASATWAEFSDWARIGR
jgi:hypothetical protein